MRAVLIAAAGLIAVSLGVSPAMAASSAVRVLDAHRVAKDAFALGQADATTVAFRAPWSGSVVVMRGDDGAVRTVRAPSGCVARTAGGGHVAYSCGADTPSADGGGVVHHLAVTSLSGDDAVRLDAVGVVNYDGTWADAPTGVGAQWIRAPNGCYHCGAWWENVNWHTGQVRETHEGDPRMYGNLDTPALMVPLCPPLRAARAPADRYEPPLTTVTVRGRWVVIRRGQSATLYRCGTANPVTLPAPFTSPVVGDGWVGQLSRWRKGTGWTVDLLRLLDRRRFTVRATPAAARSSGSLMFTHRRLYTSITGSHHGAPTGAIFTVVLPKS
jgi:hypothetical protein